MTGIDEVLERLVTDPEFRARLASDPAGALAGYMLYDEDLEVLAATLSDDAGASGVLEQRTSKTTLAGLLAAFEGFQGADGFIKLNGVDGEVEPMAGDVELNFETVKDSMLGEDQVNEIVLDDSAGSADDHEDEIEIHGIEFDMSPDADEPDVAADELAVDDSAGSSEAIELKPVFISSYSAGSGAGEESADLGEGSEVAMESLEVQHEGFEEETGHFDGRLMTARDLVGDQSAPEPAEATSGEYMTTSATHQAVGSNESLAVGSDQTEAKVPGSKTPDSTLERGHVSTD